MAEVDKRCPVCNGDIVECLDLILRPSSSPVMPFSDLKPNTRTDNVDIAGGMIRERPADYFSDLKEFMPPARMERMNTFLSYIRLSEAEKNSKLNELLKLLGLNKVIIYVNSESRADELNKFLVEHNFPSTCIHPGASDEETLTRHKDFEEGNKRILVATVVNHLVIDAFGVHIVINYDMPDSADTYLQHFCDYGRLGTKVLLIAFVASAADSYVVNQVPWRYVIDMKDLLKHINTLTYFSKVNIFPQEYLEKMSGTETAFDLLRKENNELAVQVASLEAAVHSLIVRLSSQIVKLNEIDAQGYERRQIELEVDRVQGLVDKLKSLKTGASS